MTEFENPPAFKELPSGNTFDTSQPFIKINMGFFEKWKVKRQLKALRKIITKYKEASGKLVRKYDKLGDKEKKDLDMSKEQMIISIIGDDEGKVIGLKSIFEINDEEGKEVTRKTLEKEKIDDIANLLEDLLNVMEKEV